MFVSPSLLANKPENNLKRGPAYHQNFLVLAGLVFVSAFLGIPYTTVRRCRLTLIRPTLKASGTKRLNLEHEKVLSNYAFNFNVRWYTTGSLPHSPQFIRALSDIEEITVGGQTKTRVNRVHENRLVGPAAQSVICYYYY